MGRGTLGQKEREGDIGTQGEGKGNGDTRIGKGT